MKSPLILTGGPAGIVLHPDADFALFRRPDAQVYTAIAQAGAAKEVLSGTALEQATGFLIAPFSTSSRAQTSLPVLFIRPEAVEQAPVPDIAELSLPPYSFNESAERKQYGRSFRAAYPDFSTTDCRKFVLSRERELRFQAPLPADTATNLFFKACRLYPHSYVALWRTHQSGTWLIASPETLLMQTDAHWQTMALAGTMEASDPASASLDGWSPKNRAEQAIVCQYIAERLRPLAATWTVSPTRPVEAARLRHLCTDFTFSVRPGVPLFRLLATLHPTPAVCGLPAGTAQRIILAAEPHARRYYAGFSGPLALGGETAFYVSLRCMELRSSSALLYAGGGILPESREEDEWLETCRKMQTMQLLFSPVGSSPSLSAHVL